MPRLLIIGTCLCCAWCALGSDVDLEYLNYVIPAGAQFKEVPYKPTAGCNKRERAFLNGAVVADRIFYADGTLFEEKLFKDGKQHGVTRRFHKNGKIKFEYAFKDGLQHGTSRQFAPDGALIGTFEMKAGTGTMKVWSDTGGVLEESEFVGGKRHGTYRRYYDSGKLFEESKYVKDNIDGSSTCYFEDGKIRERASFKNGKLHGIVTHVEDDGSTSETYWIEGEQVTAEHYAQQTKAENSKK